MESIFPSSYMRPQNPQTIRLIEDSQKENSTQTEPSYPQKLQNLQMPTTLPIAINKVDYTAIIAIVGIIGLLGVIALLAYLKR
jgi:hypothetical protein